RPGVEQRLFGGPPRGLEPVVADLACLVPVGRVEGGEAPRIDEDLGEAPAQVADEEAALPGAGRLAQEDAQLRRRRTLQPRGHLHGVTPAGSSSPRRRRPWRPPGRSPPTRRTACSGSST